MAKRQGVHPLAHQRPQLMLHPPRVPAVLKAGGEAFDPLHPTLGLAQKQPARIGGESPALGSGDLLPGTQPLKFHPFCNTLSPSLVGILSSGKPLIKKSLPEKNRLGSLAL